MVQLVRYCLIFVSIILMVSSLHPQNVNLPLEHWAYQYFDRLETKGLFKGLHSRTLPMTRTEIANIISEIDSNIIKGNSKLSTTDYRRLEQLEGEFHEELVRLNVSADSLLHERHLFSWSEADNIIHADADFGFNLDVRKGDQYPSAKRTSHTTLGGILRGGFKENLSFLVFVRNTMHRGIDISERNFDLSKGRPLDFAGKNAYTDEAIAYFILKLPWFEVEVGRNNAKWGPGYRGSLALSAQNPLFDMIKLKVPFKRFQFTAFHGNLNSSYGRKYLAAHRLDIQIAPWLYVAGSEAVVYGNRGMEFQYLNPIMPYHVAEHHLGDKDNNTISFDFTAFPMKNLKFYGELFLDDYTLSENFFKYYGNKWAFLSGAFWIEPFGLKNIDLRLEFARVEPFVYTHKDSMNIYQNYDQSIGHWLGPNAENWYFEINYNPTRDLSFALSLERVRKGEGDLAKPWKPEYGTEKNFLKCVVEKRSISGFKVTDQIFRDVFLSLKIFGIQTNNLGRVKNKNSFDTQVNFELLVNY